MESTNVPILPRDTAIEEAGSGNRMNLLFITHSGASSTPTKDDQRAINYQAQKNAFIKRKQARKEATLRRRQAPRLFGDFVHRDQQQEEAGSSSDEPSWQVATALSTVSSVVNPHYNEAPSVRTFLDTSRTDPFRDKQGRHES